jgi:hypothetical protein
MKKCHILLLPLIFYWILSVAAAQAFQVSRRYSDDGLLKTVGPNIVLRGTPEQIFKLTRWLDQIWLVPKGYQTLQKISDSGHELTIRHADHAILSAGRTAAPMTMDLINGVGAGVDIIFDTRIGDRGSHMVYNSKNKLIEYTAVQNLYHELAHAMHMMNGSWCYFASERQAIQEENIFRSQLAGMLGSPPTQRFRVKGIRIPEPRHMVASPEPFSWP